MGKRKKASEQQERAKALASAIDRDDAKGVREAIEAGSDMDARDEHGWSPMMNAAYGGKAKALLALIRAGADVEAKTSLGTGALSFAAQKRHAACVNILLKAGADPNAANNAGQTALMQAAQEGDAPSLMELIRAGADVNASNRMGRTPALLAAHGGGGRCECFFALMEAGASADAVDSQGFGAAELARQGLAGEEFAAKIEAWSLSRIALGAPKAARGRI